MSYLRSEIFVVICVSKAIVVPHMNLLRQNIYQELALQILRQVYLTLIFDSNVILAIRNLHCHTFVYTSKATTVQNILVCTKHVHLAISYTSHLAHLRAISNTYRREGDFRQNEITDFQTPSFKYAFGESSHCRRGQ